MSADLAPVEYRPILGAPEYYRVGSDGSIWTCARGPWRPLAQASPRDGYLKIRIILKDGGKASRRSHRVVLEAFVGPRPEGCEARHLNGIRTDNRAENLQWGTPQQNFNDRRRHGTVVTRETSRWRRLSEDNVRHAVELFKSGEMIKDIASVLGVDASHVSKILRGQEWSGVADAPLAGRDARSRGARLREERKRAA